MRRLLFSIFVMGFFLGLLTGCRNFICHTNGICDCDNDDDPCTHRAPWVRTVPPPVAAVPAGHFAHGADPVHASKSSTPAQNAPAVATPNIPQSVTVPVNEVPVTKMPPMPTRNGGISGSPVSRPITPER